MCIKLVIKTKVDTCVQSPPSLHTVEMRLLVARDKHTVMFACTQCVRSFLSMSLSIYLIAFCVELRCGRFCVYRKQASYRVRQVSVFYLVYFVMNAGIVTFLKLKSNFLNNTSTYQFPTLRTVAPTE
jgi:hypothetical protein